MVTVTLPKNQYDTLKKKASLYEAILRYVPERKWGIEEYTLSRIREFTREDSLDKKTRLQARQMLV